MKTETLQTQKNYPVQKFLDSLGESFKKLDMQISAREIAISLKQIKRINKLISVVNLHSGCKETTDIERHIQEMIATPNIKISLHQFYCVSKQIHKNQ